MARRGFIAAFAFIAVTTIALPAKAEPVLLAPGDVIRATFDLRWWNQPTPLPFSTFDVFEFIPGVPDQLEPIGSYTTRLFDRGRLLGTYTNATPGGGQLVSPFVAADSLYTRGNPTVVDFSSFRDGTIEGTIEFSISSGLLRVYRASDELNIGHALSSDVGPYYGFAPLTYEIIPAGQPAPIPEPASLLLFGTGVAALAARARTRNKASASRQ